ncbi:hypothetical protein [Halomonas organivorans]|uniref:Uncharacterized protein n=1 Tax=Halomonas organivorans TaxID=257772 RepID=A0A7W5BWU6_9GAMM|nr:hypothetical protein [Halomonas organivorans]MBB3139558.1 hypothetical protein [Halomonas organivorans]
MIRAWKRFAAYVLISLAILVGMDMARADAGSTVAPAAGPGDAARSWAGHIAALRARA